MSGSPRGGTAPQRGWRSLSLSLSLAASLSLVALFAAAQVAWGTLAIWRGYDPRGLSPGAFVEMHKGAVAGLNVLFPLLGLAAIICTPGLAFLHRRDRHAAAPFVVAALLFITAGLITRPGNQPINAIVVSWTDAAPPDG